MMYNNVMTSAKPHDIAIELMPDGTRRVIISRGFEARESEDGSCWIGKQADFVLGHDRTETQDDIQSNIDSWWEYAIAYNGDTQDPSMEQRLESVEAAILAMMGL